MTFVHDTARHRAPDKCICGQPATTRYDGEDMCAPCARECFWRDLEEGDMEPGFGED